MSAAMTFGSDNHAGIVPEVLAAIAEANVGHASGYGDDQWTEQAEALLGNAFGDAAFALCLTGTGSNVVALSLALRGWESVLTAKGAHIDLDEAGVRQRAEYEFDPAPGPPLHRHPHGDEHAPARLEHPQHLLEVEAEMRPELDRIDCQHGIEAAVAEGHLGNRTLADVDDPLADR